MGTALPRVWSARSEAKAAAEKIGKGRREDKDEQGLTGLTWIL